jgi:hypothetical protein
LTQFGDQLDDAALRELATGPARPSGWAGE